MKLQSFHSFLLATFVKNSRLGSDPQSLLRRHQTLSIIYINFALILMTLFYEISSMMLGMNFHNLPSIATPFIIGSVLCLRYGKNDLATLIAIAHVHTTSAYVSHFQNSSMGGLTSTFMFPNFSFIMSSSLKVHYINIGMCLVQFYGHINNFWNIFSVTSSSVQKDEASHMIAASIPCFLFLCLSLSAQKTVDNRIWQEASTAQGKIEKINREIMQAVESKDAFISSLSHEIRNPLNAMNGSINYLLQVVNNPQLQQVLQNAKISGETLLNLFTNLLDAAKLKSEKMELYYDDMNLYDTLKKVLIINCENIKQKKIFVDVFVDQSIPQVIQSDAARLLQILMNLMSNAIKFTPEGGKIAISATLCHRDSKIDELEAQVSVPTLNTSETASLIHLDESRLNVSTNSSLYLEDDSILTEEFSFEEEKSKIENIKRLKSFKKIRSIQANSRSRKNFSSNEPWNMQKIDLGVAQQKLFQEGSQSQLQPLQSNFKDCYLKIQITDTGCGIAEENIAKLFEMFTQAHKRVTSSHGGTGLGLWISKQLCQKMRGGIRLYSKLNEGTSFVFYLPITSKDTVQSESAVVESEVNVSQLPEKTSCLVVDDFSYNRDLYKLLLEREGVQVVVASDGEEAIEKYIGNLEKVDFILMDVQMPRMDGFTAAKKIRELEAKNKWKRVDIYFVSGEYYNEEEIMDCFRSQKGEDGQTLGIQSLKKPIDIEVIAKIAAKYIKKGR